MTRKMGTRSMISSIAKAMAVIATLVIGTVAHAANLIGNPGFEDNPPPNLSNNIPHPVTPWVLTGSGQANVVKVDGPGGYDYGALGPEMDGSSPGSGIDQHYLDIAGASNSFYQVFSVPACSGAPAGSTATVNFSGKFSTRANNAGVGSLDIIDGSGTGGTVLSSNPVNLPAGPSKTTPWSAVSGTTSVVRGSTFTYFVALDNNLNFDDANVSIDADPCDAIELGDLSITKQAIVNGNAYTGQSFPFTFNCGGMAGNVIIAAGGTHLEPGHTVGTSCNFVETVVAPPVELCGEAGGVWATTYSSPMPITIVAGTTNVTVTNTLVCNKEKTGTLTVIKKIKADGADLSAEVFPISVNCDNGFTASGNVSGTTPFVQSSLALGAICSVVEQAVPPNEKLCKQGEVVTWNATYSPATPVTITADGVTVTVENELTCEKGPPVETACLSGDPKVTCGKVPGTFVVTLQTPSGGGYAPTEVEIDVVTPGVTIQNPQSVYQVNSSGQVQVTLVGAAPGSTVEFDINGSKPDKTSEDGMSICCTGKIKIDIPRDLPCNPRPPEYDVVKVCGKPEEQADAPGLQSRCEITVTTTGVIPGTLTVSEVVQPNGQITFIGSGTTGDNWACSPAVPVGSFTPINCTLPGSNFNPTGDTSVILVDVTFTSLEEAEGAKNCAVLASNGKEIKESCTGFEGDNDKPTITATKTCGQPQGVDAIGSQIDCQITVTATGSPLPPTINLTEALLSTSTSATLSTGNIASTEPWSCIPLAGAPVPSGTPVDCNLATSSLPANGVSVLSVTLNVNGPLEPGEAQNCVNALLLDANGNVATTPTSIGDEPIVSPIQCVPLAQPDGLTVTKQCDGFIPAGGPGNDTGLHLVQCQITVTGAGNLPPVIVVDEVLQGVAHPNNQIVSLISNQNWTLPSLPVALGTVGAMTLPSADLMAAGGTSYIRVDVTLNDAGMATETQNCVTGSGGADAANLQELSPQVCVPLSGSQPTIAVTKSCDGFTSASPNGPWTGQCVVTVNVVGGPLPPYIKIGEALHDTNLTRSPAVMITGFTSADPWTCPTIGSGAPANTLQDCLIDGANFPASGTSVINYQVTVPQGVKAGEAQNCASAAFFQAPDIASDPLIASDQICVPLPGETKKSPTPPPPALKCDSKTAKLVNGSCRCTIPGMRLVSKTACDCPKGQDVRNGKCSVPPPPPPPPPKCDPRTAKLVNGECRCTVPGMVKVTKTVCACPKGQDVRNGKCSVPPPPPPRCDRATTVLKGNACVCRFDNMGKTTATACRCDRGYAFKAGVGCVKEPPKCQRGAAFNPDRQRCEPRCVEGTRYNVKRNSCDKIVVEPRCDRNTAQARDGKCVCRFDNMKPISPVACGCPRGTTFDRRRGCVEEERDVVCRPPAILDRRTGKCISPIKDEVIEKLPKLDRPKSVGKVCVDREGREVKCD